MCELLGYSGTETVDCGEDLKEFFSHSDVHCHGWGVVCFDGAEVELIKEPVAAYRSKRLRKLLDSDAIEAPTYIAHIRQATIGDESWSNCHPFRGRDKSGRTWALAHNGTIFESRCLNPYVIRQTGETDSERVFLYLVDRINRADPAGLDKKARFQIVDDVVKSLVPGNKLNLLIYDGELFYAHGNYEHMLHTRPVIKDGREAGRLFSTRPLTGDGWEEVPLNTLRAYERGRLVFSGKPHKDTFYDDPRKMELLYLAYSGL